MTPNDEHQPAVRADEDDNPDRPAILVSLAREVDERLYRWVAVGAEEEGIPCRLEPAEEAGEDDVAALAYTAARNSRLGVGIGVTADQVAVHERHMPAAQPVVAPGMEDDSARDTCRSAGSNAARLVIGVPLQLD
ncbi:MAG TPA: glycerol dehydratase reactivase beta/small subunit family protein [Rubrobacteraceae bacterium]|nr:glycerol dehydratase reactivase beta/small subunit family protein [Rubrobacteraceae bacterium]